MIDVVHTNNVNRPPAIRAPKGISFELIWVARILILYPQTIDTNEVLGGLAPVEKLRPFGVELSSPSQCDEAAIDVPGVRAGAPAAGTANDYSRSVAGGVKFGDTDTLLV